MLALKRELVRLRWIRSVRRASAGAAFLLGLFLLGCGPPSPPSREQTMKAPARTRSGAEIFRACQLCHTPVEMQRGPILNGLPAWYVEGQLQKFSSGIRGRNQANRAEALMGAAITQVQGSEEIQAVAAYIESLPVRPHLRTVRGKAERGAEVYQTCLPCHGDRAQGNPILKSPPLTVQEDWYLLDQIRKVSAGLRGYHRFDWEAQTMVAAIKQLKDEDFRDVIQYVVSSLTATNPPPALLPAQRP